MSKNKNLRKKAYNVLGDLLDPVTAIIIALTFGGIIIALLGDDVSIALSALFKGSVGNVRNIGQSLLSATPLLFTGLSFSVAYRSGLFNIGAEGQLYMGAIMGAITGTLFSGLPGFIYIPLVLLAGAAAGALWAFLPAFLKVRLGVHEVINVIMLNKIALYLTNWLVSGKGPFRLGSVQPATPFVDDAVRLKALFPGTPMNIGYLIGIFIAFNVFMLMWKTRSGYRMRAVGLNRNAAQFAGINVGKSVLTAFMLSGALAGIGGALEICSVYGRFYAGFSPGYGFEGIAVSLLGNNHPIGIVISSFLFGALKTGAMKMQIIAGTNVNLVKVLQALIIFFVAGRWSVLSFIQTQVDRFRSFRKKTKTQTPAGEENNL